MSLPIAMVSLALLLAALPVWSAPPAPSAPSQVFHNQKYGVWFAVPSGTKVEISPDSSGYAMWPVGGGSLTVWIVPWRAGPRPRRVEAYRALISLVAEGGAGVCGEASDQTVQWTSAVQPSPIRRNASGVAFIEYRVTVEQDGEDVESPRSAGPFWCACTTLLRIQVVPDCSYMGQPESPSVIATGRYIAESLTPDSR